MIGIARTRTLAAASVLTLAGLLTACGSTVQLGATSQTGALAGAGDEGLGVSAPTGTSGSSLGTGAAVTGSDQTGSSGTQATVPGEGSSASSVPTSSGATGPSTAGGSGPAAIPASGKGWNASTIYVGVMTQKDAEVAYKAAGASGIDIGDTEAQAKAAANVINSRGGIFGRKIALLFRDESTVSTATNPDQAANAACTYFTQDHPVVAVVSILTIMDGAGWRTCLAKSGVMLLSAALTGIDDASITSTAPSFTPLATPSWNSLATALMSRLQAQSWFGGWDTKLSQPSPTVKPKFGVLVEDSTEGARIANVITKALAAAGHPNALTFRYPPPGNNIQSAVLYFAGNGVDHVISSDIELSTFMTSAENQHYRPRYGITSYNSPLANLSSLAPKAQNKGAVGVGWAPNYDVAAANDPGVRGPGQQQCDTAMRAAGLYDPSKRLANAFAYSICDAFQLLAQATVAGHGLTAAATRSGELSIGSRFSSALSFGSSLKSDAPFLPGAVRDIGYVVSCSCYRYSATTTHL